MIVIFDPEQFRSQYPQFADDAKYPAAVLMASFRTAEALIGNTDGGAVLPYNPDKGVYIRELALYRAVCHLLSLDAMGDQPGRITSASEGSVSSGFDLLKTGSYSGDWWAQTACGRAVWALLLPYIRGGRVYIPRDYHPWG